MSGILTASIVITSVALVLAQYMEAHSKSIVSECRTRLVDLKKKIDMIDEKVNSESRSFRDELDDINKKWDTLNSLGPRTAVGVGLRSLLFLVFASFVLLHPGILLTGDYALGEIKTLLATIVMIYGSLAKIMLFVQFVSIVAVIWLGISLFCMVRGAATYAKRVSDLEGKIIPYWRMVP